MLEPTTNEKSTFKDDTRRIKFVTTQPSANDQGFTMLKKHRTISFACTIALAALNATPANADAEPADSKAVTCSENIVSARGEPSKFKWIARTKTRANWRQKVRAMTGLGAPYATWNRAKNPQESCTKSSKGIACEFTGIPCKKGS